MTQANRTKSAEYLLDLISKKETLIPCDSVICRYCAHYYCQVQIDVDGHTVCYWCADRSEFTGVECTIVGY